MLIFVAQCFSFAGDWRIDLSNFAADFVANFAESLLANFNVKLNCEVVHVEARPKGNTFRASGQIFLFICLRTSY